MQWLHANNDLSFQKPVLDYHELGDRLVCIHTYLFGQNLEVGNAVAALGANVVHEWSKSWRRSWKK